MGRGHVTVRDCKFQMAELWVQALSEAAEDPELRKHLRRQMREVHDFVADVIRRGQAEGALIADRDADAEAWIFLAGGVLGMVGRRSACSTEQEVRRDPSPRASPGSPALGPKRKRPPAAAPGAF